MTSHSDLKQLNSYTAAFKLGFKVCPCLNRLNASLSYQRSCSMKAILIYLGANYCRKFGLPESYQCFDDNDVKNKLEKLGFNASHLAKIAGK